MDTARGEAGKDHFFLGATLSANDRIDGGDGMDQMFLDGPTQLLTFTATTVLNIEAIHLAAGFSYTLATNDATIAAGKVLTVDAVSLGAGNNLFFHGNAETNGSFHIVSGGGNDTLLGGAGDDFISAGRGNNELFGNAGSDVLKGGADTDTIYNYDVDETHFDTGTDMLFGRSGDDTFFFRSASGAGFIDGGAGSNDVANIDLTPVTAAINWTFVACAMAR